MEQPLCSSLSNQLIKAVGRIFVFSQRSKKEMKTKTAASKQNKTQPKKDIAASYNRFKEFEGLQYTGMKVGRSHKWYYDKGVWKDTKITPDKWNISYAVTKRRAGRAPEGSGAAVGTEYHWYIMAHQMVKKLDANSYSTEMNGVKFKVAHRRASSDKWSVSENGQRKRLIKFLKEFINELEQPKAEKNEVSQKISKQPVLKPRKASALRKELAEIL
jgi:hypothetical protein